MPGQPAVTVTPDADGEVTFPAVSTDELTISFPSSSRTSTGVVAFRLVGVAEIEVPALERRLAVRPRLGDSFRLGCEDGIDVTVDGQAVRLGVDGTVQDLVELRPLRLVPCGGDVSLDQGTHEIDSSGGGPLVVSTLTLEPPGGAVTGDEEVARDVTVASWDDERRLIDVGAGVPRRSSPWMRASATGGGRRWTGRRSRPCASTAGARGSSCRPARDRPCRRRPATRAGLPGGPRGRRRAPARPAPLALVPAPRSGCCDRRRGRPAVEAARGRRRRVRRGGTGGRAARSSCRSCCSCPTGSGCCRAWPACRSRSPGCWSRWTWAESQRADAGAFGATAAGVLAVLAFAALLASAVPEISSLRPRSRTARDRPPPPTPRP